MAAGWRPTVEREGERRKSGGAAGQRLSRRTALRVALGAGAGWAGASLLSACGGGTAAPPAKPAAPASGSAPAPASGSAPASGQAAAPLAKMRMACWSNPLSEQTNVYAAQEFGWFREQNV